MKKKLTLLFITIFAGIIIFGTTAFAARKYECPVEIGPGTITKFEIIKVESLLSRSDTRIHIICEGSDNCFFNIICYDKKNRSVETVYFGLPRNRYIDVPDTTVALELVYYDADSIRKSDSLFYQNYITVFSADGKTMKISDLQLSLYERVGWYREPVVLMCTSDGKTLYVLESEVEAYKKRGWQEETFVKMYAADGRTLTVSKSEVEAYKQVGWYTEPVVLMYAADGRTLTVAKSEVEAYKQVGWYTEPFVTLYATDGRTVSVLKSEVEAYKKANWYTEPVVLMYAADGRTLYVIKSEVEAYKKVGWYTEPVVLMHSKYGSPITVAESEVEAHKQAGWYEGVTLYSEDGRTMEVSPFKIEEYKKVGWYEGVTLYSEDGREITVPSCKVDTYKQVGWYENVTLYSDDDRKIEVLSCKINEYEKVGWYTWDTYFYRKIQKTYNECKAKKDYSAILDLADLALPQLKGTKYEQNIYSMRTEAMDLWRKSSNSPLPYVEYELSENSIGTPVIKIWFTNVSYKPIIAFKVKFNCYNVFGELENSYYDTYFADDAYINPTDTYWASWTLYGVDSVNKATNIRVTEVVFSDGTKWVR